jgi:hypothetical protein
MMNILGLENRGKAHASEILIEKLDLNRHWEDVNRLLEIEGWPFVRADLDVSDEQERSIGLVARVGGVIKGFFTIHHFGDIGYLDMVIIDPSERRNLTLANELWGRAKADMVRQGFTSKVAHCTRSTARFLRVLGYRPGLKFWLLRKDATQANPPAAATAKVLPTAYLPRLVELDERVFGTSRHHWLKSWSLQPGATFVGRLRGDELLASACLRERRENSLCIDSCNGLDGANVAALIDEIQASYPHKRLECFVCDDTDLHKGLLASGFYVPDFFTLIGPLVELRHGPVDQVGTGPHVRTLSWI